MSTEGEGSEEQMEEEYGCSETWFNFWEPYNSIDNYARLTVCLIGVITNTLNMIVLTRKNMRNPINTIFTALAVTDFLCVFRKAVDRSLSFYRMGYGDSRTSYRRVSEDLLNEVFFTIFHTWSIYLTLLVAIWRYLGVLYPLQSRLWCTTKNARRGIAVAIGLSTLIVGPMYIGMEITGPILDMETNVTKYRRSQSPLGQEFYRWIHGLLIKLLPCAILTFFSLALIWTLVTARRAKKKLHESRRRTRQKLNPNPNVDASVTVQQMEMEDDKKPCLSEREMKEQADFDRTTRMILVILLIFLATEMPFGIYSILDVTLSSFSFRFLCFAPIKPFFQLNEYISSAISFFIYVYMSGKFKTQLVQIWREIYVIPWQPVKKQAGQNSNASATTTGEPATTTTSILSGST